MQPLLKALLDQVSLNQSQRTPTIVQAAVITRYCPTVNPMSQGPNQYFPSFPLHQNQGAAIASGAHKECGPTSSIPTNTSKEGSTKKPCTAPGSDISSLNSRKDIFKKDMGMFYLKNINFRTADIFPKDLTEKVCVDYLCKGIECLREGCTLKHTRWPKDISKEMNEASMGGAAIITSATTLCLPTWTRSWVAHTDQQTVRIRITDQSFVSENECDVPEYTCTLSE